MKCIDVDDSDNQLIIAFVGIVVPDELTYVNEAFSRAGNMCQTSLLLGLMNNDVKVSSVISARPIASYPRSRQIYVQKLIVNIAKIIPVTLLPFINITPIKQVSIGLSALWELVRWGWKMRRAPQRIMYTYNVSVPSGIFTLLGAWITRSKCVAMVYDIFVPGETVPATIFYRFDYWLHKKTLKLFDGLVVISDTIAQDFAPGIPYLRIEGGIKSDLIDQLARFNTQAERNYDYFTIVVTGRLDEANGIMEILAAFKLLDGERYRLMVAGAGPLLELVQDAAANDLRISYLGFVTFEEVLRLYSIADVLVNMRLTKRLNTRYFFPSKIMEYLASGVPVISTCPGNIADEYGHFAYILNDETPESLSELIKIVAETPAADRFEKSKSAQQHMAKNKTWDAQARMIRVFLDQIAHNTH